MHSHDRGTGFNYKLNPVSAGSIPFNYWASDYDLESLNSPGNTGELEVEPTQNVDPIEEFEIYQDGNSKFRFRLLTPGGTNMYYSPTGYGSEAACLEAVRFSVSSGQDLANYTISGTTVYLYKDASHTAPALGRVGVAFINEQADENIAVDSLIAYFIQLSTVDEMAEETPEGLSVWFADNEVTGIKKRMTFLTGLPNVNRQWINPYSRYNITGTLPELKYELTDASGAVIYTYSGAGFATLEALIAGIQDFVDQLIAGNYAFVGTDELEDSSASTVVGTFSSTYMDLFPVSPVAAEVEAHFIAYVQSLYEVENLHVVEHLLLRQRAENDPTLKVRIDDECPALDIEDPYSFRISVMLPLWAGRFKEQSFRSMFKRLMRAEVPAHVYINFMWLDPLQMYKFERCWSKWLEGDWQDPSEACGTCLAPDGVAMSFIDCFNQLCNLSDAKYSTEPLKVPGLYENCDLIAAPFDPDGEIVRAFPAPGFTLPDGLCLDACSGAIRIEDKTLFEPGLDSLDFNIKTINAGGEEVCHQLTMTFPVNGNATIDVSPSDQNLCYYFEQWAMWVATGIPIEVLGFDDAEGISQAMLDSWRIEWPSGTTIASNPPDVIPGFYFNTGVLGTDDPGTIGSLFLDDPNLIIPGIYFLTVTVVDGSGVSTSLSVSFTIFPNVPATVVIAPPLNEDAFMGSEILATITDSSTGQVSVSAISPSLASLGLSLNPGIDNASTAATIVVSDSALFQSKLATDWTLVAGYYRKTFAVSTYDPCGGVDELQVELVVKKDNEAYWTFTQSPSKNVSTYVNGNVLGNIQDPDGSLLDVTALTAANNALLSGSGLELYYTTTDPVKGYIKVSNKAAFKTAINNSSVVSNRIATLTFTLETKDETGGLSDVPVTIQAKQDIAPIVTIETARTADSYEEGDVMATIEDFDGMGIVSASPGNNNFALSQFGLGMRVVGPFESYPYSGEGMGNSANYRIPADDPNLVSNGRYQILPEQLYPTVPQSGYVEIFVQNAKVFRSAYDQGGWSPIDPEGNPSTLDIEIYTTDSEQGLATSQVQLAVLPETVVLVQEFFNNERCDRIPTGATLVRINLQNVESQYQSASYSGTLPSEFNVYNDGEKFQITSGANSNEYLPVGEWPIIVTLLDPEENETVVPVTVTVRPRLVSVNFAIEARQMTQMLNLNAKISGLKMLSLKHPYLPRTFGRIAIGNGKQIAFSEGSSFGTSTYSMTAPFNGIIIATGELVDGELTISRKSKLLNGVTGSSYLEGNSKVGTEAVKGNAKLAGFATETGKFLLGLEEVTYFSGNPNLHSKLEEMASYANGEMNALVAGQINSLSTNSANEIVGLIDSLASGAQRKTNSKNLEGYAELFRLQLMAAVHFAGFILEDDIALGGDVESMFMDLNSKIQEIFQGQIASSTLPELNSLRQTLLDLQDVFGPSKPVLQGIISKMVTFMPISELHALGSRLQSPHSGNIDAEMSTIIEQAGLVLGQLEGYWSDPAFRLAWTEGQFLLGTAPFPDLAILEFTKDLAKLLNANSLKIKDMAYGTQLLDAQHNLGIGLELFNLMISAWLGFIDLNSEELDGNAGLLEGMGAYRDFVMPITRIEGTTSLRNLIARWIGFWAQRPQLVDSLRSWVNVAELRMEDRKGVTQYKAGDVIATVLVAIGEINAVSISKGRLPKGMELTTDGKIIVSDPELLIDGIYGGLEISGANDKGFRFALTVPDIYFEEDQPATYIVLDPVPMSEYYDGQVLAYPEDTDTEIDMVQFDSGSFPKGVRLDTETGEFSVASTTKLVEGVYPMTVIVVDVLGAETTHEFEIQIGSGGAPAGGKGAGGPVSISINNIPLPQEQDAIIGSLYIASPVQGFEVTSGAIPLGIRLQLDGQIQVTDPSLLAPGNADFAILVTYANMDTQTYNVSMSFIEADNIISLSAMGVTLPQPFDASIVQMTVTGETFTLFENLNGTFPSGLNILEDGTIFVQDPSLLKAGGYYFTIDGFTESERFLFQITIEFVAQPTENVNFGSFELPQEGDTVLGTLFVEGKTIASTTLVVGSVPSGLAMLQDGKLVVEFPDNLVAGTYNFGITAQFDDGTTTFFDVVIEFI